MIHNNLGNLFDVQYDSDKAIEHYTKALKIAEEIDDNYLLLFTLKASGKMFYKFNLFDKSIEHYTKALKIAEEIGDDSMNSEFYNFIGNSYDELSDIEKAIEFHNKVLEISKENKWKDGESISLSNLGIIYYKIGDFERAIEFHDKAIEIAHTTGNIDLEGSCYGNLGNALLSSGDSDLAIICHEESLTLKIRSKNRLGELKCYGNLGNVYNVQAEFDKAIEYHSKALKIAEEIKDFTSQSICHIGLSQSYTRQNNLEKAKHHMEASLRISQQIGNLLQEIRTSYYLGKLNSFDSLENGYFYVKKSVELIDNLGKKLLLQENKIEFYAFMYDIYSFIVYLSYKLNKSDELFRYIEKSKSNAFINLLSLGDFRINEKYHSKDILLLLDEEKKYLTILKSLETNTLISYKDSKIHYSIKEIEKIYNQLKEVYGKLEHYIPAYVSLRRATYLELPKIQNILSLQGNPVIIEYFILDRSLLILIISKNNYQIIEREISKERLEKLVFEFLKNIKNQKYGNKITNSWLELSNILIKPIDKLLKDFDFIYIIPNDFLYYIPIHALELNSKPLIQTYPVIYLQSASMLQFYNTKGSGVLKTCASFGVVFLSEAKQVSHIFNSNLFINATRDDVTSNLEHDILHFSCHGEFNTKDPLKSCIHLHHSSLTIKDIFELKINSEIVTLSACETGISKIKKGDELIGLIRSFSYAGAASLLVTLWKVDALATEKFMKKFYSNLKKGYNKIKSLQIAQLYVMEKYPDPFYWSPFVLWGDFD